MKRISLLCLLASLILSSCQSKKEQIVIEGKLKNANNEWVRLALIGTEDLIMLDSVRMENGSFRFTLLANTDEEKARAQSPMMYQIILSSDNSLTTLAKGGEHITIEADAGNLLRSYTICGGEEAVLMAQLDSALTAFVQPTEALYAIYEKNIENDSIRSDIEQQYVALLENHKNFLNTFIRNHPNNMAAFIAFYQSYNRRSFFNEMENLDLLRKITHSLRETYPDNPYVKSMQLKVQLLEQIDK